ncbi:MAG: hypothetical protein HQK53_09625 [Oligoflexia bacterium]|nr:hypothetical protein [Oligoflexia bacterium]
MKCFILKILVILVIWVILLANVGAQDVSTYYCNINLLPSKQQVALDKVSEYVHRFSFEKAVGVKTKFSDFEVFLWSNQQKLYMRLKDTLGRLEVSSEYPSQVPEMVLKMNKVMSSNVTTDTKDSAKDPTKDIKVQCLSQRSWERLDDDAQKFLFPVPFNDSSELIYYKNPIALKLMMAKSITFKYNSTESASSADKMQAVYFQQGKIVAEAARDMSKNWCIFQIQRKIDQDLTVNVVTQIPVLSTTITNQKDSLILNYNFVDFNSGEKGYETFEWAAFALKCKINSNIRSSTMSGGISAAASGGMSSGFSYRDFKELTGNYFKIEI